MNIWVRCIKVDGLTQLNPQNLRKYKRSMNIKAQFLEENGSLVLQNLEMGCSQVSDALGRRKGQVDTEVKRSDAFAPIGHANAYQ